MDCSTKKKNKNFRFITLKGSIMFSYILSISTNFFLIFVLFLTERYYRWAIYPLHIGLIVISILSFINLMNFSGNNISYFKTFSSFFQIIFFICFLAYFIVFIYLFATKQDKDIIVFLILTIIFWCCFNVSFISVIKSFIKNMEDKPSARNINEGLMFKIKDYEI